MIWDSKQIPQQAGAVPIHRVIWDFFKMLVIAVMCGFGFSIAAAGITLLLTGSAEARRLHKDYLPASPSDTTGNASEIDGADSEDSSPAPGALFLGDGCESTSLKAIERDWHVRIDGRRIEVRVMQTFKMPAESAEAATFHVQLVKGAHMESISAQTSTKDWAGNIFRTDEYDRLTPAEYLNLSRIGILASHSSLGTVTTSPIVGLSPDDLIVISYTYVVTLEPQDGLPAFILPLEAEGNYAARGLPETDEPASIPSSTSMPMARSGTRGAVWVEWIGDKPWRVTGLPEDADVEMSKSLIGGFSWATGEIQTGARFHLSWAL